MSLFGLEVASVIRETKDTVSVLFKVSESLADTFAWQPGQHVQVQINIGGSIVTRHYSISANRRDALQITVKHTKGGVASHYINYDLKLGDVLQVSPPKGRFLLETDSRQRKSYYFFAAGSGITPIYAMLVRVLEEEPESFAYLLYGNKNAKSTIFRNQLQSLAKQYPSRFIVADCHSDPSWFKESPWRSARIDALAVNDFIKDNPPYAQNAQYYLCGPGAFLPDVKRALNNIDVPDNRIHMESFGGQVNQSQSLGVEASLEVILYGNAHTTVVAEQQTLLEAMRTSGIDSPSSCEGGVCGTCQCHLEVGEVSMMTNLALGEEEVKQGAILACQAVPTSSKIKISYQ